MFTEVMRIDPDYIQRLKKVHEGRPSPFIPKEDYVFMVWERAWSKYWKPIHVKPLKSKGKGKSQSSSSSSGKGKHHHGYMNRRANLDSLSSGGEESDAKSVRFSDLDDDVEVIPVPKEY